MSLKGSLQTAALTEVLRFLSDTGKTGEFHLSGSRGEGRLWIEDGRISGFQAAKATQPFEAIFELLRIDDGEFDFEADTPRPDDVHPVDHADGDVGAALEAAEARMAEWVEIVKVVPTLSHRVKLREEMPSDAVILDPEQWMLVVAVGAGRSVGEVIEHRGMQEFDGCRSVRTLVDASLAEVVEPAEAVVESEPEAAPEAEAEAETVVESEPEVAADSHGAEADEVDHNVAPGEGDDDVAPAGLVDDDAIPGSLLRFGLASDHELHDQSHDSADEVQAESEDDHYASLRAVVGEIADEAGSDEVADDSDFGAPVYEIEAEPQLDGRAALRALLSEVATPADGETVDGLADRGPWTDNELSSMDSDRAGWHGHDEASNIVPFGAVHAEATTVDDSHDVDAAKDSDDSDAEEEAPVEEPINRGLLLKFLSSVRN